VLVCEFSSGDPQVTIRAPRRRAARFPRIYLFIYFAAHLFLFC
jgi:hypothetical protein